MREIFEAQKKTLIEKNYLGLLAMDEDDFNRATESAWNIFKNQAKNYKFKTYGTIPLLLVVNSPNTLDVMEKIGGHTDLKLENIKEKYWAMKEDFYFILDVEDGEKIMARSPKRALKTLKWEGRFALNLNESLALITHYPQILQDHFLVAAGSYYPEGRENLPLVWGVDGDSNPVLKYSWFDIAYGNYGIGSCAAKTFIYESFKMYGP